MRAGQAVGHVDPVLGDRLVGFAGGGRRPRGARRRLALALEAHRHGGAGAGPGAGKRQPRRRLAGLLPAPLAAGRHGDGELPARLGEGHAGDAVAFGEADDGLGPDLLVERLPRELHGLGGRRARAWAWDRVQCPLLLVIPICREPPLRRLRLKVEHAGALAVFGYRARPFAVATRWFTGRARGRTYALDELLGTKLRVLYQRRRGRDLFDLWDALRRGRVGRARVVQAFEAYLEAEGLRLTGAQFARNLTAKVGSRAFLTEVVPMLVAGVEYDGEAAADVVRAAVGMSDASGGSTDKPTCVVFDTTQMAGPSAFLGSQRPQDEASVTMSPLGP